LLCFNAFLFYSFTFYLLPFSFCLFPFYSLSHFCRFLPTCTSLLGCKIGGLNLNIHCCFLMTDFDVGALFFSASGSALRPVKEISCGLKTNDALVRSRLSKGARQEPAAPARASAAARTAACGVSLRTVFMNDFYMFFEVGSNCSDLPLLRISSMCNSLQTHTLFFLSDPGSRPNGAPYF
jgi:hypothetical protein